MRGGRRAIVLGVLAAAVAIAATGCGGGGGSANTSGFSPYEVKMQALGNTLNRTLHAEAKANATAGPAGVEKNLRTEQAALRSAAVKLGQITPPANAAKGHALLITGVREYANEIDSLIAKVRKGHLLAAYAITNLKGVKDMSRGTEEITKAGYVIAIS
jgi:hypothetical protein